MGLYYCGVCCLLAVSKPTTIAPAQTTIRHIAPVSCTQPPLKIALSVPQNHQVSAS